MYFWFTVQTITDWFTSFYLRKLNSVKPDIQYEILVRVRITFFNGTFY